MGHGGPREIPRNDADVLSQRQRRSAGVRHNQLQHICGNEGLGPGAASVSANWIGNVDFAIITHLS